MIEKLPESEGAAIGVKISGKVSLEMEKEWIGQLEQVIAEHGEIKILVHLDGHPKWGLKAGLEDFKWLMTHMKVLKKLVIVAESDFWKWYVALDSPFGKVVGIEEKYFKPEEITAAWEWIKK